MLVCSLNKLNAARAGNSDRALEMLPCQNASSMVAMTVSSGLDDMHLIGRGMGGLARDVGCAELVRDWGNYWHHRLERVRWDDIKRQSDKSDDASEQRWVRSGNVFNDSVGK